MIARGKDGTTKLELDLIERSETGVLQGVGGTLYLIALFRRRYARLISRYTLCATSKTAHITTTINRPNKDDASKQTTCNSCSRADEETTSDGGNMITSPGTSGSSEFNFINFNRKNKSLYTVYWNYEICNTEMLFKLKSSKVGW